MKLQWLMAKKEDFARVKSEDLYGKIYVESIIFKSKIENSKLHLK